jgi:hypothetical protein
VLLRASLAAVAATILTAGTAHAATVTVGSSLAGTHNVVTTGAARTNGNLIVAPPGIAASPVDGTVVSWRFIGPGPLIPRVIRPLAGGLYVGAGRGVATPGAGSLLLSGPFPVSLPIRAGDLFGFDTPPDGAEWAARSDAAAVDARRISFTSPLPEGNPAVPADFTLPPEYAIQATVRYCVVPDLKGKGRKTARNALLAADCTVGTVRKSKKVRKRKKIVKQSVAPGTSVSDTEPINLKFSRRR